jgi:hypothetical protein
VTIGEIGYSLTGLAMSPDGILYGSESTQNGNLGDAHLVIVDPVLCQNSADVFCPGITGAEEPLHLRRWRETGRRPTDRSSGVRAEVIDHFAGVPWHDAES